MTDAAVTAEVYGEWCESGPHVHWWWRCADCGYLPVSYANTRRLAQAGLDDHKKHCTAGNAQVSDTSP